MTDHLDMWIVYKHPKDFPDKYVVRLFEVTGVPKATAICFIGDTQEEAESQIPGLNLLSFVPRMAEDELHIVGVWM